MPQSAERRIPSLDGLRTISIALVPPPVLRPDGC